MRRALLLLLTILVCSTFLDARQQSSLAEKIRRFAPTEITAKITGLSPGDRTALNKLIAASKFMDSIYLRQVWSGNADVHRRLMAGGDTDGVEKLAYFRINMGPWSKLDHDEPFVAGVPNPKPPGANYYPEDMTKEEFEAWVKLLPDEEKKKATGFFHVIRRDDQRHLMTRPYPEEYGAYLAPAAALLEEAAASTENATLKDFLAKRAKAFLSNDYYESDVAWMDLDSPIEPTIGPYEVYLDDLFNYKAAFESFITLRNDEETKKLDKYAEHLQEIENLLPIDAKYRNPKLGALSPIRVVDVVVVGGEARAGVQTAAFNLPNDEAVVAAKGSKRVMLKNVQEAKFNTVLLPIAAVALEKPQQPMVAFEPFFTQILAHELMHGLGPHNITVNGKSTTVRQEMKELSSALEEAKADVSGIFALEVLMSKGVVEKAEQAMYVTYLAGMFRSVRFGINDAHGKGTALQFNYLRDAGAITYDEAGGTFGIDPAKMSAGIRKLTGEIMTIQAEGSYAKAKALFEKFALVRPEMQQVLAKLGGVPVDIAPSYPLAE